ncbi:MAG: hypothetical protein ACI8RZ_006852 [Myxococcota bacterium]|jgi:hypothetical protein
MGSSAASPAHVEKQAWEGAGYTVESVDLQVEVVTSCRL